MDTRPRYEILICFVFGYQLPVTSYRLPVTSYCWLVDFVRSFGTKRNI